MQGIRSDRQVPEELWMKVWNTVQEAMIKTITKKKKQKGKMAVLGGFKKAVKSRDKKQRRKRKI